MESSSRSLGESGGTRLIQGSRSVNSRSSSLTLPSDGYRARSFESASSIPVTSPSSATSITSKNPLECSSPTEVEVIVGLGHELSAVALPVLFPGPEEDQ